MDSFKSPGIDGFQLKNFEATKKKGMRREKIRDNLALSN